MNKNLSTSSTLVLGRYPFENRPKLKLKKKDRGNVLK